MMHCSGCSAPMVEERHFGIVLDRCPKCGSVWFDHKEVNLYLDTHPEIQAQCKPDDTELHLMMLSTRCKEVCPRCNEPTIEHGTIEGIEFRRCSLFCGFLIDSAGFGRLTKLDWSDFAQNPPFNYKPTLAVHAVDLAFRAVLGVVLGILEPG